MRVMIISNIFPPHVRGGYELGMLDVARAFIKAGHEVEVVTSTAVGVLNKTRPVADVSVRQVFEPVLAYESDLAGRLAHSSAWRQQRTDAFGGVLRANVVALRAEIERFRPDRIWIGNPIGIGPIGVLETALSAAVPVLIHLMDDVDSYLVGYRRPIHWLARAARMKQSMTAISCASHVREMNSVVGRYRTHHLVSNGVDFAAMPSQAEPGRHGGPLRFVYFGQVEPMKGVSQLIRGLSRFADVPDSPSFTLDIIGPAATTYAEQLGADLKARGLEDRVRLVGRLEKDDLMARLAGYDVAVLLLKHEEPFGYAWLEAAAAGLPVVVTRGRAVGDVFPTEYPLFVEDRADADGVAGALRWCTSNRASLAPLGRVLRAHLLTTCDTGTAVHPRYLDILESAERPSSSMNVESLLASAVTVDAYAMVLDGENV
ncbi:MAG: glycosyltransferase family 4 protein [Vicinamibacterales bacterium]